MATIVTRSGKGSPLTNNEVDANFTNLNTELGTKANTSSLATVATTGAYADLTGKPTIASADGSVVVTGTTNIDLSVAVAGSTSNVVLPIRNTTGATLAKGTAVYISGATGQISTVSKAIATGDATSAQTLGLVTANIANNSNGNVTLIGTITNIDTSAYTDGQQLYLSPTTAGTLTATKPYAPQHLVYVAVVEHAHPSQGKLFVKVQNGYEMDELHDVSAQNPANNDGLFYNTSTSLWEKKSIATALGFTPYNATNPAGYITGITSGNVTTALGYTPANRAGDTFTGPITVNSGANQAILGSDGAIELTRGAGGAYIDFKDSTAEDFDVRLQASGNQLNISAAGGLTLNGAGVLTGITSGQVTTALGYTPANKAGDTFTGAVAFTGDIGNAPTAIQGVWVGKSSGNDGQIQINGGFGHIDWANGAEDYDIRLYRTGDDELTLTGGHLLAETSVRSPIFYDSNNTAYYLDAAGNSVFSAFNIGGGEVYFYGSATNAVSIRTGAGGAYRYFTFDASGNFYALNGSVYGQRFYDQDNTAYYVDPNAGSNVLGDFRVNQNGAAGIQLLSTTGTQSLWIRTGYDGAPTPSVSATNVQFQSSGSSAGTFSFYSGNTLALSIGGDSATGAGSLRAPIFYDSNNTAFYVDPASTSVINGLNAGIITAQSSNDVQLYLNGNATSWAGISWADASGTDYIWYNGATSTFAIGGGGSSVANKKMHVHGGMTIGSGIAASASGTNSLLVESAITANQIYSQIFYDSQNGAYYVDPASNSVLNTLTLGGRATTSAMYYQGFTLDANTMDTNATGFTYGVNAPFVGPIIRAGESGYSLQLNAPYGGGGRFAFRTRNGDTGAFNSWQYPALYDQNVNGGGALYATTYYDQSNTNYYCDPASTSVLNVVAGYSLRNIEDVSVDTPYGIYFSSNFNADYAIHRESGAWSHPYPDLRIAFHTGIKIGAAAGYNGVRFYDNSNMLTQVMSVNNGSDALGTGNVYVNNSLQAGSSLRAPIFYDSNDTSYYLDPNSTSVLNAIQPWGEVGMRRGDSATLLRSYNTSAGQPTQFYVNHNLGEVEIGNARGIVYAGGSYWQIANSVRAPIFYDSNDTGYYLDPASTSRINQINYTGLYSAADGNYGVIGGNGYFDTVNSGYAGDPLELCYVKGSEVRIGTGGGNLPIKASVYYKGTNTAYYLDPEGTSNLVGLTVANRISGSVFGCTFTQDSQDKDDIATRSDSGFYQSSSGTTAEGWPINDGNWQHMISCTHTNDGNYFAMQLGASFFSQGLFYRSVANSGTQAWSRVALYDNGYAAPLYASIYYDADNTGYYVDPFGTSITNVMRGDKYHSLYNGGQPAPRWDNSFYVLQSQHWYSHTGAMTMYVGESGDFVYIRGYTTADGSSRAPIFYDNQNTGYYVDPSSTGTSLNVAGNIDCYARSAAWAEGVRVRVPSRSTWGGIRFTRDEGNSNGNWAIGFTGIDSTDDLTFWGNLSGSEGMRARLTQTGNFTATGNVTAYSDARLKENVATITNALDLVGKMRGVTYTRKDTGEAGVGVIAQEMREIMPQVVLQDGGEDGTLSVAYGNLVGVLIEAIKELRDEVEMLRK